MEYDSLKYLVEIIEKGSINKAAQSLFIPQSTLSVAMSRLEEELNITIFKRNPKGVSLTVEGRKLYIYSKNIIGEMNELKDKFKSDISRDKIAKLTISSTEGEEVKEAFNKTCSSYDGKEIDFFLNSCKIDELLFRVKDGVVDLGVTTVVSNKYEEFKNRIAYEGLEFFEIKRAPLKIFIGKGSTLYNNRKKISLEEFCSHKLIKRNLGEIGEFDIESSFESIGISEDKFQETIGYTDFLDIESILHKSKSFIVLPEFFKIAQNREVRKVDFNNNNIEGILVCIKKKEMELKDIQKTFIDILKE